MNDNEKSSATFLGCWDKDGNEMHCKHKECPHDDKCRQHGCICRVPRVKLH